MNGSSHAAVTVAAASTRLVARIARWGGVFALGFGFACGGASAPPAPPVAASPSTSSSASAATAASAGAAETPPVPTPSQRRPLDITSQCENPVAIFVGSDPPKSGGAGKRIVEPMQILPIERNRDGLQTVWLLLDESLSPLIKVDVTRGMKHIEVGRSCRTLDAR